MKTYVVLVDDDGYELPDVYGPFLSDTEATNFADAYVVGFGTDSTTVTVVPILPPTEAIIQWKF